MNKSLIFLFFVSTLFLWGACQDSDEFNISQLHSSLADAALKNPRAKQLLLLMDAQQGSFERLQECLGDNKPLFEGVRTGSAYDFGPYYAIPYQNEDGVVMGCAIFPMDENVSDKEKRSIIGQLGVPVDLNESYLYGKIPTVRRALYSSRFIDWENMGLKVSPELTQFSKELNEHTVQLSTDECSVLPQSVTRSTSYGTTVVWLNYDLESYSVNGISYAMSIYTFMDIVKDKFDSPSTPTGPFHVETVDHYGYQMLRITMYVTDLDYYNRFKFETQVRNVLSWIKQEVMRRGFSVTMQYSYTLAPTPVSDKPQTSSGGSIYTGSGTGSSESEEKDEQDVKEFKLDCSQNTNRQYADSVSAIMDKFTSTNTDTYPNTMPYSEYLQKVHNDSVEYSTCFSSYPDDGINTFSPAIRGDRYSVNNELSPSAVAEIHNHPNGTPPSFRDILFTAKNAMDSDLPKYKATFIYNQNDSSYYVLYIKDAQKAGEFYEKYKGELDEETNSYEIGGYLEDFLKSKGIKNDKENFLYAMTAILGNMNTGISLHKVDKNKNRITYNCMKRYNNRGDKEKKSLIFVYCNY